MTPPEKILNERFAIVMKQFTGVLAAKKYDVAKASLVMELIDQGKKTIPEKSTEGEALQSMGKELTAKMLGEMEAEKAIKIKGIDKQLRQLPEDEMQLKSLYVGATARQSVLAEKLDGRDASQTSLEGDVKDFYLEEVVKFREKYLEIPTIFNRSNELHQEREALTSKQITEDDLEFLITENCQKQGLERSKTGN